MSIFGPSQVRERILVEFFAKPATHKHVREVARLVGASAPTVGEELARLAGLGVLRTEQVGRSLVYSVNEASALVADLKSLVQKTLGVESLIRGALAELPGADSAYIFGSHASGRETATSDVDLLVVGEPDRVALSERLARVERAIGRDVNVVTMSAEELRERAGTKPGFWAAVLAGPLVQVAGEPGRL